MRVVYTSVVGDLIHVGHMNLFRQAKELGDKLVVGVITDEGVENYKRKPIIPFNQRIEVVSSIKYVDLAIQQNSRSGVDNMKKLENISILVRGDDTEISEEVDYIQSIGGRFVKIPFTQGISTSLIIDKIYHINNKTD